ncbi:MULTISPECIES: acylphosphatase [unclassified Vibrio]|uniref:acylphosphatase n=1 Tax=unclassified Vibrio TaxID=2614977 RepID=UPI0013614521|nr:MULTISPECIES: acylphosphatase [unclassified Vibrio]NAW57827.1 acylphosphatase [Vibrio sp. V36_P2S2PM302]NAX20418.1 acylphosphatase [Vibrio sp. V39_P1S14PM300]NAX27375.1 acylphosphatase [Vibrio sp. V38_P2S17PM301]NAX30154.1 acylphosphatase [Vibrio sp. V37_P2S8PM304]
MEQKCVKFTVSGVVQGVGFRYHTCYEGLCLGLTGYAKNLSNGDVEVMACGQEESIEALAQWLNNGPKMATVDRLEREEAVYKEFKGFEIL